MNKKVGVIPFKTDGDSVSILLITSSRSGRPVFPKGNLEEGESFKKGGKREAFEEAGIKGKILDDFPMTCTINNQTDSRNKSPVRFYPMLVTKIHKKWPEDDIRKRTWMPLNLALSKIKDDDIAKVIRQFHDLKPWILEDARSRM